MRCFFYVFVVLFVACQTGSIGTNGMVNNMMLKIYNLPIDSCSIRFHHIITGKEVFYQDKFALVDTLKISDLEDDMYIIVVSWPKTYISHQVYNNPGFDKEKGDDYFELTKPIYFNKRNDNYYVLEMKNNISQDDLEQDGAEVLKLKKTDCSERDLAEEFWGLYTDFYLRKWKLLDSLKLKYYASVDSSYVKRSVEIYNEIEKMKVSFVNDDLLDKAIIKKLSENEENPISTFFLFYQLYNYRDFSKFKNSFLSLSGKAKESKYYRMLEKQYL